jgi:hypothetical protein
MQSKYIHVSGHQKLVCTDFVMQEALDSGKIDNRPTPARLVTISERIGLNTGIAFKHLTISDILQQHTMQAMRAACYTVFANSSFAWA